MAFDQFVSGADHENWVIVVQFRTNLNSLERSTDIISPDSSLYTGVLSPTFEPFKPQHACLPHIFQMISETAQEDTMSKSSSTELIV